MSLSEALLELANKIEKDCGEVKKCEGSIPSLVVATLLGGICDQIRIAVKASERDRQEILASSVGKLDMSWIDKTANPGFNISQQKATKDAQLAKAEESEQVLGSSMIPVIGGHSDGDMAPIDPKMSVGAKTLIAGEVYQLSAAGTLCFMEEATRQRQSQLTTK